MERIPEPELMDEPAQATAYAEADFAEPHNRFVDRFAETFPDGVQGRVLDLGCGPADVTIRFARAHPDCRVDGIDGARAMLRHAREAVRQQGLTERIRLIHGHLPDLRSHRQYDAIISNSLLHHLTEPRVLWEAVQRWARSGAAVFVMDLMRPEGPEEALELVEQYARGEPEVLQRDFHHSLLAAYRPEEVEDQLQQAGLRLRVEVISDRHLLVSGRSVTP